MSIRLLEPSFEPWRSSDSDRQVAVLMSGGVDSSVAAMLLKKSGWQVLGVTMKIPMAEQCEHPRGCCGTEAALVCEQLGICHYFVDVQEAFDRLIIEPFRRSYQQGLTPNPCVDCNALLKFGLVWDFLEETFGVRHLATGHYARVLHDAGGDYLARASDPDKDQSHFLYRIARERLGRLVLPLGERSKESVRELARASELRVAARPESMELCFAGEGDYRKALADAGQESGGDILDVAGKVIGRHEGIFNHTVGQRRGLGIAAPEPLYVLRICPKDNTVTVGTRSEALCRAVLAKDSNILMPNKLQAGVHLLGKIRSYGELAPCVVREVSASQIAVEFDEAQFAPTPGQRLVLYDADGKVVAGGTICGENDESCAVYEQESSYVDGY